MNPNVKKNTHAKIQSNSHNKIQNQYIFQSKLSQFRSDDAQC